MSQKNKNDQDSRVKSSINNERLTDAKNRLITDIERLQQEFEEKRKNFEGNSFSGTARSNS